MKIVSINGSDGIGKTQQISLLRGGGGLHFTGRLVDYSNRWPKFNPIEEFGWWFKETPFPEIASIVIESIKARHSARNPELVNVDDRGTRMFKAVLAATLLIREQGEVDRVIERIDGLFAKELADYPQEEEILLKANPEYRAKIKPILQIVDPRSHKYLAWQNEMYAEYQTWLSHFMNHYLPTGSVSQVVHVDSCILDTQNEIRRGINALFETRLPALCGTLKKLVAFGGLSECGKSSFADGLSRRCGYYRLKIKYFEAAVKAQDLPSHPGTIGRELLNFLNDHKHVELASIESIHSPDLPAYLKLLFGQRFKTVYLDTPESIRARRTADGHGISLDEAVSRTKEKDAVKISRGADRVRDIADIVFSNESDGFDDAFQRFIDQL